jgi:hypothetical protein
MLNERAIFHAMISSNELNVAVHNNQKFSVANQSPKMIRDSELVNELTVNL